MSAVDSVKMGIYVVGNVQMKVHVWRRWSSWLVASLILGVQQRLWCLLRSGRQLSGSVGLGLVRFAMDRAGLVGADGATHSGFADITYMACIPNMVVMAPSNEAELCNAVATSIAIDDRPSCFRFPRGNGVGVNLEDWGVNPITFKGTPWEVRPWLRLWMNDQVMVHGKLSVENAIQLLNSCTKITSVVLKLRSMAGLK